MENGGEESTKTPCRKVKNPNINAFSDPNPIVVEMLVYPVHDISILSSGTPNLWNSLQQRNHRF
jgi:hypothetical protein